MVQLSEEKFFSLEEVIAFRAMATTKSHQSAQIQRGRGSSRGEVKRKAGNLTELDILFECISR